MGGSVLVIGFRSGERVLFLAHTWPALGLYPGKLPRLPGLAGTGYNIPMLSGFLGRIIGRINQGGSGRFKTRHLVIIGDSMRPTLAHRQHVQTRPFPAGCRWGEGARGAIVAFRHPQRPRSIYIKRIVGLPNEHIALENDRVLINGALQPEPYRLPDRLPAARPSREYAGQWFTDSDEYFLLGDNRGDSEDSRTFGPVCGGLIIGRVWFRYWPPYIWRAGRAAREKRD